MTDKQPEALRLAKILEDHYFYSDTNEAAAELRRLHAENEDFRATCDHLTCENAEQIGEIVALKEQRSELLEALKCVLPFMATETTNCHGDKCRERWCSACFAEEDAEIAAEMGRTALMAARNALAKVGGAA